MDMTDKDLCMIFDLSHLFSLSVLRSMLILSQKGRRSANLAERAD